MLYVRLIKMMVALGLGLSLLSGCKAGSAKFKKPLDKTLPPDAGTTPPPDSGGGTSPAAAGPRASVKLANTSGAATLLNLKNSTGTALFMKVTIGGRITGATSSAMGTDNKKVLSTTTGVGHGL